MQFLTLNKLMLPTDGGPIYKETVMGRLPVEPFNTFSNLIFLGIIVFFFFKIKENPKKYPFLLYVLPILTIGYVGGTLFHGTRSLPIWLYMDWVPIMVLCVSAVFYFIFKLTPNWYKRFLSFTMIITVSFVARSFPMPATLRISLGYVITAITVILPIALYLIKTKGKNQHLIYLAIFSFLIAVSFRSIDRLLKVDFLYMGTHWLWHIFGGISVFFLMYYVYQDRLQIEKL